MSTNRLQLNSDKTEFMWLTTARSQHQLPTSGLLIGSTLVSPSAAVRDLGIFCDQDLTTKTHVQQTAPRWFATRRQLRSIRRYISTPAFQSLVSALVLSRLDYCNSLLINLPLIRIQRLQSKMPQQGSCSTWDVATTSLMRSLVSIGSACQSELHSRWRCWRTVHSTAHAHRGVRVYPYPRVWVGYGYEVHGYGYTRFFP